jgi:hypothetical protein
MTARSDQLRAAFDRHRTSPFPPDSLTSDELSDLHAELVEYDGYVAGLISSVLGGSSADQAQLRHDRALGAALKRLAEGGTEPVRSEAQAHLDYYRRLEHLLDLAGADE